MPRIVQDRRQRQLRAVWTGAALVALTLAVSSVVFTAWTWGQTRSLSLSFKSLQYHLEQVNAQREAMVSLLLERRLKLDYQRMKRETAGLMDGTGKALQEKKRTSVNGRKRKENQEMASHFEIKGPDFEPVGAEGIIKGWTEEGLNATKAVSYDAKAGTFKVEKRGVYFLYCQVHFNENQSSYVKLEVSVGPGKVLQCVEGYGTTPSSGARQFQFLKPCQVSGLLRLEKGAELKVTTGADFTLLTTAKHYFGLFKVT